jgi:hypothetical protein
MKILTQEESSNLIDFGGSSSTLKTQSNVQSTGASANTNKFNK